jgi:hypothetical protein
MSVTGINWNNPDLLRLVADLTGDGKADIVGFSDDDAWISLNNGDGTFGQPKPAGIGFGLNTGWTTAEHPRFLADLTGDGKADIVGFGDAGVWIALNNGGGTFGPAQFALEDFGYQQAWRVEKHVRLLADLTGDCKGDIVGFGDAGVYVALNNGSGGFGAVTLAVPDLGYNQRWRPELHPRFAVDLTGDGRADIIGFGDAGVWVALNNGDGTFGQAQFVLEDFGTEQAWRVEKHLRLLADLAGNGRADIVGFGDAGVYVSRNNGGGSFGGATLAVNNLGYHQGWRPDLHPRFVADITGNGNADIIGFGDAGVWTAVGAGDGSFAGAVFVLAGFAYDQAWTFSPDDSLPFDNFSQVWTLPGGAVFQGPWLQSWHPAFVCELDGDGKADIIGFGDAGVWTSLAHPVGDGGFNDAAFVLADFGALSHVSNRFAELMAQLAPQGWWRLDEKSPQIGSAARDSSSYAINGTYQSAPSVGVVEGLPSVPGATLDLDTGIDFGGVAYVEVPDHDIYSLAKANDSFHRVVDAGWGDADHGGTWAAQVSNPAYFSCADGLAAIDETGHAATWMIGLPIAPYNADIQIETSWDDVARGGPLAPCSLVGRRKDNYTYYKAELVEQPDHSLELSLWKNVAGTETRLAVVSDIGTYASRDGWFVRFQIEGPTLRARAWNQADTQPANWLVTAVDTDISDAGGISVLSSNSASQARPTVKFSRFWVQTLGFTVHAFMRLDKVDFPGENDEQYVHWLGKGGRSNYEWTFRVYSRTAPAHMGWVSFYVYSLSGGLGAGAAYHGDQLGFLEPGTWYQFIGVLDPGDLHDPNAGAWLYLNGQLVDGVMFNGNIESGSQYQSYNIIPGNGSDPLRLGTLDKNSFLPGGLDEIAIFDRKLTADEIAALYQAAVQG